MIPSALNAQANLLPSHSPQQHAHIQSSIHLFSPSSSSSSSLASAPKSVRYLRRPAKIKDHGSEIMYSSCNPMYQLDPHRHRYTPFPVPFPHISDLVLAPSRSGDHKSQGLLTPIHCDTHPSAQLPTETYSTSHCISSARSVNPAVVRRLVEKARQEVSTNDWDFGATTYVSFSYDAVSPRYVETPSPNSYFYPYFAETSPTTSHARPSTHLNGLADNNIDFNPNDTADAQPPVRTPSSHSHN